MQLTFDQEVKRCPLCSKDAFKHFANYKQGLNDLKYQICKRCGMVFQSPQPSSQELEKFYEAEYRIAYDGQERPSEELLKVQRERGNHLASFLKSNEVSTSRHLDIGCSTGELLKAIRNYFPDVELCGVEPSRAHRKLNEENGIRVYSKLEEVIANEEKFDSVSMSHVLEHIPEPVEYLKTIRTKVMKDGGALLLEVPNLYGHGCFEVAHCLAFSMENLEDCVRLAGFKVQAKKIHNCARPGNRKPYLTLIAISQPDLNSSKKVRSQNPSLVKAKRLVGLHGSLTKGLYAFVREYI